MLPLKSHKQLCSIMTMKTTMCSTMERSLYTCRLLDVVDQFYYIAYILLHIHISWTQTRQWLYCKCSKSLIVVERTSYVYLYRLYWEKNLSNDQCCFRVDIWGVYTACLSCNNFFCFLFVNEKKNSLWGLCMKAAICCTWANNCVYTLMSFLMKVWWSGDCIHTKMGTLCLSKCFVVSLQKVCVN